MDKYNKQVSFYPDVPSILLHLASNPDVTHVVSASRTQSPRVAQKLLNLLHVSMDDQWVPSANLIGHKVWGRGSKLGHFREIKELTGIEYDEMLFFDDELRNREVEKLGVTFIKVEEETGVSWDVFRKGVEKWRSNHSHLNHHLSSEKI